MSLQPAPEPPSFGRFGRLAGIVGLVVVAAIAVVGGASYLGRQVGDFVGGSDDAQVEPGMEVDIVVPPGSTAADIGAILSARGVVRSPVEFDVAVRSAGAAASLRAGTYELETGMDPADVVTVLIDGPITAMDVVRVTVPEGLRVGETLAELAEATGVSEAELLEALESGEVTTTLREMPARPQASDWEGLLFPDTYELDLNTSPAALVQRLVSTMEQRVAAVDWSGLEEAGLSTYEGIILASLVESEVRVDDERPLVSSVIHNRLAEEMPLQIDATVLYAMGTRSVEGFDREIDSPYNTYVTGGLPPTPISGPGLAALRSAAQPPDTDFLFYVLSDEDGSHTFTTNFEDHQAAVNQARSEGILP